MKYLLPVWLMVVCLPLSVSASDDEALIRTLFSDWRTAVEQADVPAYLSVLDDDIRLIPPGAAVIEGRDAYEAFLGPVFEAATYRIEVVEPARIELLGDLALAEYRYVIHLTLKDTSEGVVQAGALTASKTDARYFDVLRKTSSGQWRVWRHTWQTM